MTEVIVHLEIIHRTTQFEKEFTDLIALVFHAHSATGKTSPLDFLAQASLAFHTEEPESASVLGKWATTGMN